MCPLGLASHLPRYLMLVVRWHRKQVEFFGSTITEWLAYGLAVFLILFPKGGFKVGPIPLTWGYGIVGIALTFGVPFWLIGSSYKVRRAGLGVFYVWSLCRLFFFIVCWSTVLRILVSLSAILSASFSCRLPSWSSSLDFYQRYAWSDCWCSPVG